MHRQEIIEIINNVVFLVCFFNLFIPILSTTIINNIFCFLPPSPPPTLPWFSYSGYESGGVRKAAVRETTGPLKAWLHEHRKNPYPTKAEKIMLAIITQMTLTQVLIY